MLLLGEEMPIMDIHLIGHIVPMWFIGANRFAIAIAITIRVMIPMDFGMGLLAALLAAF